MPSEIFRVRGLLALVMIVIVVGVAGAKPPEDYRDAKDVIDPIYRDYPVTAYCACTYNGKGGDINPESCGLDVDTYANRKDRVEWEHVMPASYFGHKMACWDKAPDGTSGRDHCRDTSEAFSRMEADLYNLQPSVGSLNAVRSNHPYGIVEGERREFGKCDFEDSGYVTEPPPWFRGDAARTWFYMRDTYGIPIDPDMEAMLEKWARQDPPDQWEKVRARRIGEIQGQDYTVHFDGD